MLKPNHAPTLRKLSYVATLASALALSACVSAGPKTNPNSPDQSEIVAGLRVDVPLVKQLIAQEHPTLTDQGFHFTVPTSKPHASYSVNVITNGTPSLTSEFPIAGPARAAGSTTSRTFYMTGLDITLTDGRTTEEFQTTEVYVADNGADTFEWELNKPVVKPGTREVGQAMLLSQTLLNGALQHKVPSGY